MVKLNGETVYPNYFPDGTLNLSENELPTSSQDVYVEWYYDSDAEFIIVAYLAMFYKNLGCGRSLFLPYLPNARMDRVKYRTDVFSLKFFAALLNALEFDEVYVLDPHSSVSEALIENLHIVKSDHLFSNVYNNIASDYDVEPIVVYPDEGAMKRYAQTSCRTYPYAFGIKNRDWKTGEIKGLEIFGANPDDIVGKPVIIRDDICSYGGTFYYTAKKLKEMGAGDIYLFVTHCEENVYYGDFDGQNLLETGLINHIYTTNSIYHLPENNQVTVYNASEV